MATSVHLLFSSPRLLAMRRAAAAKAAPGGKNGSLGGEPLELEKLPPQERCVCPTMPLFFFPINIIIVMNIQSS